MEEKNLNGNSNIETVSTAQPEVKTVAKPAQSEMSQPQTQPVAPSLLTQEEVNKIVAGRIREVTKKLHEKYGVKTEDELNALIGKGQAHDVLKEQMTKLNEEISALKTDKLLRLNKVRADKFADVVALLKGKNLPINADNIKNVLNTHPEWLRKAKPKVVAPIGANKPGEKPVDEKALARSFFQSLKR
jgi:hypothetical protein